MGASPTWVNAGEPSSRPQSVAERSRAERGVKSLFGGSKRAGRVKSKPVVYDDHHTNHWCCCQLTDSNATVALTSFSSIASPARTRRRVFASDSSLM